LPALPLRSRITTDGIDRAPHRAFMRGMGLDDAAIARPFLGVVTTAGETTPCNGTLAEQAAHAHEAVAAAGGTPRAFSTISVSDGISMNHQGMKCSLVSREVIADSIELVVRAHRSPRRSRNQASTAASNRALPNMRCTTQGSSGG
jgi:dihydroxy-acid dehydratase